MLQHAPMFLLTAVLSGFLVAVYFWLARRYLPLDQPGQRSSHERATPTGAGIACVLSLTIMSVADAVYPAAWNQLLLPGALALTTLGFIDDLRPLSATLRLLVQALLALGLLLMLPFEAPLWSWGLVFLWLLWSVNSFNFMDGSHGMAALQAISGSLMLAFFFAQAAQTEWMLVALLLAAVSAGFLPWNFPEARVFLGDAGSLPLGWLLAGLTLVAVTQQVITPPVALLLLGLFHVDAGMTMLSRMLHGEEWYTAHRQHLYQRLLSGRWKHAHIALGFQAINVAIIYPLMIFVNGQPAWQWTISACLLLSLAGVWVALNRKL